MEADCTETPVINLLNMNARRHKGCHYILTSPRSLQACANLRIKPIDVLAQSLEQFRRSGASQGFCGSLLVAVHNELEKQKQVKLQKARSERDRIISEEHKCVAGKRRTRVYQPNTARDRSLADSSTVLPEKDMRILSALVKKGEAVKSLAAPKKQATAAKEKMKSQNGSDHQQIVYCGARGTDISRKIPLQHERILRKKDQETKLREIQVKQAELGELLEEGIRDQQNRAAKNRVLSHSRKYEQHEARSGAERERFMTSRIETDYQARIVEETFERSLRVKDCEATQRLQQQKKRHQHEHQLVLEKRIKMTVLREKRLNELKESLNNWQEQTEQYREQSIAKAGEKHSQMLCERVDRLQQKHKERTKKHEETLLRLHKEDVKKRAALAQEIEARMHRAEELDHKQRDTAAMMRQTAQLSARLRQTVKNHYTRNTFSKMARDAEMYTSLERCHHNQSHNSLEHSKDCSYKST